MLNYLILFLSTLFATGKALFCKVLGTGHYSKKEVALLNFKSFFIAFTCSLFFVAGEINKLFEISGFSIILSTFFGASVAITQIMQSKALGNGPASIVTLIYSCGFVVPVFYGAFFWNENVSLYQWIGIFMLIAALAMIVCNGEKGKTLILWLPFAIASMLGSGMNAIFQKSHSYSYYSDELPFFLVYSLFFSALFTGIAYLLICKKKENEQSEVKQQGKIKKVIIPLCLGVFVGLLNFSNLYLSGKLPAIIHFPIYNVGSMLLTSIISAIIYKDRLTKRQMAGFVIGITAIIIVGIL